MSTISIKFYYSFYFYLLLLNTCNTSSRDFHILRNSPEKALYIAYENGEITPKKASFELEKISGHSYCVHENFKNHLVFEVRYTDPQNSVLAYTSNDFQTSKTLKDGDFFVSNADQLVLYKRVFDSFDERLCYKPVSFSFDPVKSVFEFKSREMKEMLYHVNSDLAVGGLFVQMSEYPFLDVDFETLSALNQKFYENLETIFKEKHLQLQEYIQKTVPYTNPTEKVIKSKAQSLKRKLQTFCEEREKQESKLILSNLS